MITCIIVEDEVLAQDVIKNHLQRIEQLQLAGVYRTAPEAYAALQKEDIDVMFLDIRLPGRDGLNFLRSLENPPLVVLTTAYAEYALEGYDLNVIDYLLKPISFERFAQSVDKIVNGRFLSPGERAQFNDHIFIKSNSKFFRINFSEILYVQGMKDYVKIHTGPFTFITHQTMNEVEKTLPARHFIRVHKSYIIATGRIRAIYGNSIDLEKTIIPIGLNYKESVMALVGKGKQRNE